MGKAMKAARRYFSKVRTAEQEKKRAEALRKRVRSQKAPSKTLIQLYKPTRNTL